MNRTITIAPVHKTVLVQAMADKAFEVFTAGIDRWWPKSMGIGATPVAESVIEPFLGGRWYTKHEDGTEAVVGHIRVWEPPHRFVVTWEINAAWKPDARVALASGHARERDDRRASALSPSKNWRVISCAASSTRWIVSS